MTLDLGELYAASRYRITDLMMTTDPELLEGTCPSTPDWTMRQLLAHVRGVTEDVRLGNVSAAGTDPWTADQVRRHASADVMALLAGWSDDAPLLEGFLSSPDGATAARAVVDVNTHEADLRAALGRVVHLPDLFGDWVTALLGEGLLERVADAGLPPLRVETAEGDRFGPDHADVVLRSNRYELFRAVLGRRSPEQVGAYDWGGADPSPYLRHMFALGPRDTALIEEACP